jgi:hypothetical protein
VTNETWLLCSVPRCDERNLVVVQCAKTFHSTLLASPLVPRVDYARLQARPPPARDAPRPRFPDSLAPVTKRAS